MSRLEETLTKEEKKLLEKLNKGCAKIIEKEQMDEDRRAARKAV